MTAEERSAVFGEYMDWLGLGAMFDYEAPDSFMDWRCGSHA